MVGGATGVTTQGSMGLKVFQWHKVLTSAEGLAEFSVSLDQHASLSAPDCGPHVTSCFMIFVDGGLKA